MSAERIHAEAPAGDHDDAPVFFEGRWPYRTWRSAVLFTAGAGCGALFAGLLRSAARGEIKDLRTTVTFTFLLLFSATFAYAGLVVWWRFLRGATTRVRIDGGGVSFGSTSVGWEAVGRIYVLRDNEGYFFNYHRRSRRPWAMDRPLMTIPRPTPADCHDVLRRLRKYLRTRHPHVTVG